MMACVPFPALFTLRDAHTSCFAHPFPSLALREFFRRGSGKPLESLSLAIPRPGMTPFRALPPATDASVTITQRHCTIDSIRAVLSSSYIRDRLIPILDCLVASAAEVCE